MTTEKQMIEAIRSCPLVGRGSCSTIDECMSDSEIAVFLKDGEIDPSAPDAIRKAIDWALDFEELHKEQALNQRFGDDDDWQLKAWEKWTLDRAAYSVGA